MKKISIILVNYNGKQYNEKCIETLLQSKMEEEIEIWIVDNGSTDNSIHILQEKYNKQNIIHFILLPNNYGFAIANNEGIKAALRNGCDYLLLLNNDTEVHENAITNLLRTYQKYEDCVVVPKIYYFDEPNKIWYAGGKISKIVNKSSHIGLNKIDKGKYNKQKKIDFATGCCIFTSKETIKKLGLLDESYFLYYEDNEWSFRMKALGINIIYQPESIIYHKVNGTTQGNQNVLCAYYISRNWLICNKKYLSYKFPFFLVYFILNRIFVGLFWLFTGRYNLVRMTYIGIIHFFIGKTGKYRED